MPDTEQVKTLTAKLYDFHTRAKARRDLGKLGDAAASALLPLLSAADTPENVRWSAITLLAECKFEPSVPALLDIVRDDLRLRGEAVRALQNITGKDIGEDPQEWVEALTGTASARAETVAMDKTTAAQDGNGPSVPRTEQPTADAEETSRENVGSAAEPAEGRVFRQALQGLATKITWEDAGYLYMRLSLHEGRKQQMIVQFGPDERSGEQTVMIYTECGPAVPEVRKVLPQRNSMLRYGAFMVEEASEESGEAKVIMRHHMPLSKLTTEKAREIVIYMANEADALEYAITGSDQI